MRHPPKTKIALALIVAALVCTAARAQFLDQIGVTTLRAVTTNLDGSGVRVAQPEANTDGNTNNPSAFEVNPAAANFPAGRFTYTSDAGTAGAFPNSAGNESGHADGVAQNFYGISGGVATNVAHVDNYDADYFYGNIIAAVFPPGISSAVVNQSFTFGTLTTNDQKSVDSQYDDYAAQYQTLFISAVDNGGNVHAPGTSYNCIGVAAYGGGSSTGPTLDNGRAKPDITAPADVTSFSTPQVAGAAAVLMQAGLRGDGGSSTNSAADIRTVKALLLNGAIKPTDWTNHFPSPLDARYGAGVLNVFNSYKQLTGGKHGYIASATVAAGGAHPPNGATGTVGVLSGWDFNTNTSSSLPSPQDGVRHYYFDVTNASGDAVFTATATLVWNRQQNQAGINNLDLFLYAAASSNLVMCSTSLVDNVEHVFVPRLPQGRYDLQVLMNASGIKPLDNQEPYALAWEFFTMPLSITPAGTNAALAWPVYPTGFVLESTTSLASPSGWSTNNLPPPAVTNQQNYLLLNNTNGNQFFRLRRPNF